MVTRGRLLDASELESLIAVDSAGERVGLLTYRLEPDGLEVVTLDSLQPSCGIGAALLKSAIELARDSGCSKLWLVTTNDNLCAITFYEHRGLRVIQVRKGAIDQARLLKASIPTVGDNGIGLHDEVELALEFVAR